MLTAPILYVGEDLCCRIPVIERYGARVRRVPCSARELRVALADTIEYSAVAFNEDLASIPHDVIAVACSYPSPLVLFENPCISYDPACFDLIIPTLTPPALWLRTLQETINESRKLHAQSRALLLDVAAVRAETRVQRSRMHRLIGSPIDIDKLWRLR